MSNKNLINPPLVDIALQKQKTEPLQRNSKLLDLSNPLERNCLELEHLHAMMDVPILEGIIVGDTGYLDRLRHTDMTAPVMKGKDGTSRLFIAIKVDEARNMKNRESALKPSVVVIFQRYSDKPFPWVMAVACGRPLQHEGTTYLPDVNKVRKLLAGFPMRAEDDHSYWHLSLSGSIKSATVR